MKNLFVSLGLVLIICKGYTFELKLLHEFDNIRNVAAIDPLGIIYTLDDGILTRLDSGKAPITYNNPALGRITHVDVSNPLSIVAFFGDFGTIALLDRNLTEKKVFKGHELQDYDLPFLVSSSSAGGFWAYFDNSSSLVRFSNRGLKIAASNNIINDHPQFATPVFIAEYNERVYLLANGIWVFDQFANFVHHITQIPSQKIQLAGNKIYFLEGQTLKVFNIEGAYCCTIDLPPDKIKSFFIRNDILYLQTDVSLKKFRISAELK